MLLQAVALRLRYNYIWIFSVLLIAWLSKVHLHPTPAATPREAFQRLGIGPFGGWSMLAMVGTFYVVAIAMAIWGVPKRASVDEVRGLELQVEQWKT